MNTYRVRVTTPTGTVVAEVTGPGYREAGQRAATLYKVPLASVQVESDPRVGFHKVFDA